MSSIIVPGNDPGEKRSIWVPGQGNIPMDVIQVSRVIEEYDTRLSLGRDERSGEWVVLREDGPEGIPFFPVMGLGIELPSADRVKAILFSRDVARNGSRIVQQVVERQNRRRKNAKDFADSGAEAAAEALEWGYRRMGGDRANAKVFIAGRDDASSTVY